MVFDRWTGRYYWLRGKVFPLLPIGPRRHWIHKINIGSWGNFRKPTRMSEKINWRMIHDRRQLLVQGCDKVAMKELARQLVPGPELRIPETYWVGTDLDQAPDPLSLPGWVAKPTVGSGSVILDRLDRAGLKVATADWGDPVQTRNGEWGYSQTPSRIVIEERLPVAVGDVPVDYKFWVFNGRCEFLQIIEGRFSDVHMTFCDREWNILPWEFRFASPLPKPARPADTSGLIEMAERLGRDWDFVRVDLYRMDDGQIWFGEFTPYPHGGDIHWLGDQDTKIAANWVLPRV